MAKEGCSKACYCHTRFCAFTVSQAGEWVSLEIWRRWRRKSKNRNQRRLVEKITWGMEHRSDLFRWEEGYVPHLHTHGYMILPLVPHPSMSLFIWTPSCRSISMLVSFNLSSVFVNIGVMMWEIYFCLSFWHIRGLCIMLKMCPSSIENHLCKQHQGHWHVNLM